MTRSKWMFDGGGLNEAEQTEWNNLVSGKTTGARSLKEALSDAGIPPDSSVTQFIQGLPKELQTVFEAAKDETDFPKVLAYTRNLLHVTELIEKQDFEYSVMDRIRLVLKYSSADPDAFRCTVRTFQGATECLLEGPLPNGVCEVPEILLEPPRQKLLHIASIEDSQKRIEAYWDDREHEFWSVDSDGGRSRTSVYNLLNAKRDDITENITIAESLLRLGIAKKIGHMHYYAQLMDHLTMLREQYLKALTLVRNNWESPGLEREIRALLVAVAKMHPVFYIDKHAKDAPPNMVYLGTWADPADRISVPLMCNLDGAAVRIGDEELPVTTAASRHRSTSVPLVSDMVFCTLAIGHAVGLIAKCPESLFRQDEQAKGCPICLDVLLRKGELPLVCTGCGRGETP